MMIQMCVIISWEHRFKLSLMTDMLQCGNSYILIVTELEEVINYCIPKCISDMKEESETNSAAGFDSYLSFCWVEVCVPLMTHSKCFPDSHKEERLGLLRSQVRELKTTQGYFVSGPAAPQFFIIMISQSHTPSIEFSTCSCFFPGHFSSHWSNTISRYIKVFLETGIWTGKLRNLTVLFCVGEHSNKMKKSKKG